MANWVSDLIIDHVVWHSLYHGPSNLMLGELGTSVLNPGRPNNFFHLIFYSKLDKNNIFGHI